MFRNDFKLVSLGTPLVVSVRCLVCCCVRSLHLCLTTSDGSAIEKTGFSYEVPEVRATSVALSLACCWNRVRIRGRDSGLCHVSWPC